MCSLQRCEANFLCKTPGPMLPPQVLTSAQAWDASLAAEQEAVAVREAGHSADFSAARAAALARHHALAERLAAAAAESAQGAAQGKLKG